MTPIRLYTAPTPNGQKASIMLEEVGLAYDVHLVDIERGDQHAPKFLALNPNNKIPVIVDPDRDRTVFESGAILHYLAERTGTLLPDGERARIETLTWTFFQAAHVGPTLGQLWHYTVFARERLPAVIARFEAEAGRVLRVLDGQLSRHAHIAGAAYGIADVMTFPWIRSGVETLGLSLDGMPHLTRWYAALGERPAIRRGLGVPVLAEDRNEAAA